MRSNELNDLFNVLVKSMEEIHADINQLKKFIEMISFGYYTKGNTDVNPTLKEIGINLAKFFISEIKEKVLRTEIILNKNNERP